MAVFNRAADGHSRGRPGIAPFLPHTAAREQGVEPYDRSGASNIVRAEKVATVTTKSVTIKTATTTTR